MMAGGGYVLIHRGLFSHAVFRNLTEAMTFAWLISMAAWRPTRVRYRGILLDLERAQFAISMRDLAERLDWSEAAVRRYLRRLEGDGMIRTSSSAGVTVVTISNYDKFQLGKAESSAPETSSGPTHHPTHDRRTSDAAADAPLFAASALQTTENSDGVAGVDAPPDAEATQQRRSSDAQNNESKALKESKKIRSTQIDADFEEWYAQVPLKQGKGDARKKYKAARKKADRETLLLGIQRYAALNHEPKYIQAPARWLDAERWLDEPRPSRGDLNGRNRKIAHGQHPRPGRIASRVERQSALYDAVGFDGNE